MLKTTPISSFENLTFFSEKGHFLSYINKTLSLPNCYSRFFKAYLSRLFTKNATTKSFICRKYLLNLRQEKHKNTLTSTEKQILTKVKKAKRGSLFFIEDFIQYGNTKAVSKILERLVQTEQLHRVARGMYARLEVHPDFGAIPPSVDVIAKAIARRDKAKIIPSGALSLNLLGLSTQVPLNPVYLTNGSARKVKVGNQVINFKKTAPKNLAAIGEISALVIQALKTLGANELDEERKLKIIDLLKKEDAYRLSHDIKLAPDWIRSIMKQALQND